MGNSDFTFETVFFITSLAMYMNRSHPSIVRNFSWVLQFLIILTLSVTTFVFLTNSLLFYDIPAGRYSEASKNGTMAIVALTVTLKYTFMLYYQTDILAIINTINQDYLQSLSFEKSEREIVVSYAKRGANVSKYWLIATTVTTAIFPVRAVSLMVYYLWMGDFKFVPMFDMRYPDRVDILKDTPFMSCFLFFLCLMFGSYATTMYIGFDPLVPIFLLHICGQLDILSKRMMEIFITNSEQNVINYQLKQMNMKLQELYRILDSIKTRYTILFEFNLKTTTFLLPLSLFQVVEGLGHQQLNLEFLSFFMATILHFYMPCYYSDVLMGSSEKLREAVYSSSWEKHPDIQTRKTILIMMTRTNMPLVMSTVFFPVCLDTFAEMCRQSYAIFNILNAAWA